MGNQNLRNSKDKTVNTRGKELLDICKINDFLIMNGRKTGDIAGNCTSHQWNGSSVVDYAIVPNKFANKIQNFHVDQFIPWLSDHSPIHTTINFNHLEASPKSTKSEKKGMHVPKKYLWNDEQIQQFTTELQSEQIQN